MSPAIMVIIGQIVIALSCIIGYVVMTVMGFDGTPLLTVLVGQGVGAGLQLAYQQASKPDSEHAGRAVPGGA